MNCREIENLLDEVGLRVLTTQQQASIDAHLLGCEDCACQWQALAGVRRLDTLPTPSLRAGLFAETMQLAMQSFGRSGNRYSFLLGTSLGGAIAASIVLAIVTLNPVSRTESAGDSPMVTMALNEVHDIGVSIDSSRALTGAEVRVVLTGDVRLVGFDDQTSLSWRTDLDAGVNRLTLPVMAISQDGGQVLVEVKHDNKQQTFLVDVAVDVLGLAIAVAPAQTTSASPTV
jgi:hypothetical protein